MTRRIERALWLAALALAPAARAEVVDRIVLRVNGEIATLMDYEQRKQDRIDQIAQAPDLSLEDRRKLVGEAGKTTMKEIFDELLVLSRARQLHIEVAPAQVDRAVENSKRRFGIEDDADFVQALAQSGLTMEEFRRRMGRSILLNSVFEREVQDKVKVDDEAVARYWHDHATEFARAEGRRIEEVVVRDDAGLTPEAQRALADAVAAQAATGAPLADVAREAGGGDAAATVIDHGWVEAGTLAPELEQAAWALAAGGVSAPVAGRGGLHVLRVAEIRAAAPRPFDEVREEIRARIGQEKVDQRLSQFLAEQAASAYVVENLPPDAAGYREAVAGASDPLREMLRGAGAAAATPAQPGVAAPAGETAPASAPPAAAPPATAPAPAPAQSTPPPPSESAPPPPSDPPPARGI